SLVALQAAHRDDLQVVALALDDGPIEAVRAFAARHKANFPIVAATPDIAEALGGIEGLPTTLVFDAEGRQVERHLGFATRELLDTFISRARQSR
ncbi:MAG: TlpA family protein disulfide reductase, partial [Vicinamibacterales bacterium]